MDKKSMTMGLLVGGRIAGLRKKATLVAYLYNGLILPALPEWDKETYPYAFIAAINSSAYVLWVSSEKTYVTGDTLVHVPAPSYNCDNLTKAYIWDDWGFMESDYDGYYTPLWSNYDLLREDGTLFLSASEPVKTYLDYVIATLFDGEAVTADDGNGIYVSDKLTSDNGAAFGTGNAYRITIDGAVTIEDVSGSTVAYYLGNPYLYKPDNYEDNGGSWCVRQAYSFSGKYYYYNLYTRTGGTHKLKLESVRA